MVAADEFVSGMTHFCTKYLTWAIIGVLFCYILLSVLFSILVVFFWDMKSFALTFQTLRIEIFVICHSHTGDKVTKLQHCVMHANYMTLLILIATCQAARVVCLYITAFATSLRVLRSSRSSDCNFKSHIEIMKWKFQVAIFICLSLWLFAPSQLVKL